MISYDKYRKHIDNLAYLKAKLEKNVSELANVRSKYVTYLKNNPYKENKIILEKQNKNLVKQILKLIPTDWK